MATRFSVPTVLTQRQSTLLLSSSRMSRQNRPFTGYHPLLTKQQLNSRSFVCAAQSAETQSPAKPFEVVTVDLGDRTYPIYIGSGLWKKSLLRQHIPGQTVLIVTNETIGPLYLQTCIEALKSEDASLRIESVQLPDGEEFKNVDECDAVWSKALECNHTRHIPIIMSMMHAMMFRQTTFVALGGGVVGDMTGFAAACYQRGVHFLQIPTTLMAQVDSSVGGKTGVNHALGKNMIGAFYQPTCVLIDTDTLNTLPGREFRSGLSEVVKYGLIRDAVFFEWLEGNMTDLVNMDPVALTYAIQRSCINKAEVVIADEKEAGLRATLNLGHTFGHAIETFSGYGTYLHGEAISIGITMAADLSLRLGWIDADLPKRIANLFDLCQLPTESPKGMSPQIFRDIMMRDKKNKDGQIRLLLLKGRLGECVLTSDFDDAALDATLEHFCH